MQQIPEQVKAVGDAVSIVGIISVWVGVFTNLFGLVAAIATAAWAVLRLYETKTVQEWLASRRAGQKA